MPTKLSRTLAISLLALSLSGSVALAAQPTLPPPGGNVPAPINIGAAPQSKAGTFGSLLGGFWDLLGLNSVLFTGETSVNPVPGACPAGYSWVEEGNPNGTIDNGECNIISFFAGTNGNVGIGTTNPAGKLHTYSAEDGSYNIFETANYGGIKLINGGESSFIGSRAGKMYFYAGDGVTEDMTILNNGNVGIGTMAPGQKLEIVSPNNAPGTSGTSADGALRVKVNGTSIGLDFGGQSGTGYSWIQSRNILDYATNYSLSLNPNGGNVGIGTNPTQRLSVAGNINKVNSWILGDTDWGANTLEVHNNSWDGVSGGNYGGIAAGKIYSYGGLQSGGNSGSEAAAGELYVAGKSTLTGLLTANGDITTPAIKITGGSPTAGKVWTSSGTDGSASWATIPGATAETDPTVPASVKDGTNWSEISSIPAGFADNVDNDTDTNTTYSSGSGLSLTGTTFSLNTANANVWRGEQTFAGVDTYFPDAGIWNTSGNVGIGTISPGANRLYVNGNAHVSGNLDVGGNTRIDGRITALGGPNYTSPSLTLLDQNRILFVHNLGYIPWCNWTSSNRYQVVSLYRLTTAEIELHGWSPSLGQSTDVVVRCW